MTKRRLLAAEIFEKIERCDFITRSHRSGYITTWLFFQLWVAFLLSHSSRFLRHSVSVGATQENNSPSVCR